MHAPLLRRNFMKTAMLAASAIPLARLSQTTTAEQQPTQPKEAFPTGKIGSVDFYLKTLHAHDYFSAPKAIEEADQGRNDNYWCRDPEEVIEFMFKVKKPWIAFKVMAAGAIPPRRAFSYALNAGADFVLAGMFDWQIAEDVKIAREALAGMKRSRPFPETGGLVRIPYRRSGSNSESQGSMPRCNHPRGQAPGC
jgi:hypothetical protein